MPDVSRPIPYGRQEISDEDIAAVVAVLRSDFLTQGPAVKAFEEAVAAHCKAKYAVAVANATAALHIACLASDLGPGDGLWTSPNTFVASANCALYCGAGVDFIDIDPRTYNLSVTALEEQLRRAEKEGGLPKVVVPVDFAGQSCDMQQIKILSERYGFKIIEDASHAVGGRYQDAPIGNCAHADMTVFSFHPVKIMTTGEGGMVLTNDAALYERLLRLRSHGVTRDPAYFEGEPAGAWDYQQIELGYNYRLTDLQAALGISQLSRLDDFVSRRHAVARRYDQALSGLPVKLPWQDPAGSSALHLYPVCIDQAVRRAVFDALRSSGILVNVHYIPVYQQPYYRKLGFKPGHCPEAEAYYAGALSLPMYAGLSESDQARVVSVFAEALT